MTAHKIIQSFRFKILAGYGGALAVVALVFVWAVASLLTLGQAADSILRENYKSILAAENMINSLERQDSAVLSWLLGVDAAAPESFRAHENEFQQWLGRAKDNVTIPEETDVLLRIEEGYGRAMAAASPLLRAEPPVDTGAYMAEVRPRILAVRADCTRLREVNQQAMTEASAKARGLAEAAVWRTGLAGLVVVFFGFAFSVLLSSRMAKPVEEMRAAALRLAEGDYDVTVPVRGEDELSQLAERFNTMAQRLRHFHDLNIGHILAEKRKNEAILQSVDDGIVVVDSELRIVNINPMAAGIFDKSCDAALDRHFLEVVGDERLLGYVRRSLETGEVPALAENEDILTVGGEGGGAHYQFSVIPVRVGSGSVLSVVLLLRDVTRLYELDRLKSEFVMTASHELRTPLTSIGMSVDMLLEKASDKLDGRERELLVIAQEDLRRLKALVNELLDLSRIEVGRMEMDIVPLGLGLVFEKAASVMEAQAEERGVALAMEPPSGLPKVEGDPNKITWVLVNLLGNALRHTQSGGHVRVAASLVKDHVQVSVNDDGEGIPLEYQTKIFDKFVQVKSDRTSGGSGLGLAICKEIVRAHGGAIWVESSPGEGSTFTFTLRVAA